MWSLFVGISLNADIITNVMVRNHYNVKFLKGYGFSILLRLEPFLGIIWDSKKIRPSKGLGVLVQDSNNFLLITIKTFFLPPFFLHLLLARCMTSFSINFCQSLRNTHFLFTNTANQLLFLACIWFYIIMWQIRHKHN